MIVCLIENQLGILLSQFRNFDTFNKVFMIEIRVIFELARKKTA